MTLGELVERLGGKLVQGNSGLSIDGVSSTVSAGAEHVVFAQDAASAIDALSSAAGAVVLRPGLVQPYPVERAIVETPQPRLWFSRAARVLRPVVSPRGAHSSAVVARTAHVENTTIEAGAVIGEDVNIGARSSIGAGAVIGQAATIGQDCRSYPRVV